MSVLKGFGFDCVNESKSVGDDFRRTEEYGS
jgi:hypothetical protein